MSKNRQERDAMFRRVEERRKQDPLGFNTPKEPNHWSGRNIMGILGCFGIALAVVIGIVVLAFVAFVIFSVSQGGWG